MNAIDNNAGSGISLESQGDIVSIEPGFSYTSKIYVAKYANTLIDGLNRGYESNPY